MAKIQFKPENRAVDPNSFPKLKLDTGEAARILCFEDPEYAYVHNLRAPKIVNGVVQYKTFKTKAGEEYEKEDMEFIGNPICLGDDGVLQDKGVDPTNCPACKMAVESDMVDAPKRRFAMHVVQYNTNGKKLPVNPFGVTVKVWAFTDVIFNKLLDILDEAEDLRKVDLILGPCTEKQYQKFDIIHSSKAAWLVNGETQTTVKTAIAEQKAPDLLVFIGRKTDKKRLEDDLNTVRAKWRLAKNAVGESAADGLGAAEEATLSAGLSSLLDEEKPSASAVAPVDDLVEEPKKEEKKKSEDIDLDGPIDFDEVLASLGE